MPGACCAIWYFGKLRGSILVLWIVWRIRLAETMVAETKAMIEDI